MRSPLHVFIEEAQVFVPQKVQKGEERMLGAFEDIIKLGRNFGIGATLISQRPQSVNKDALNQTEALFVLQTNGAQERKALENWIVEQGIATKNLVDELPGLPTGTAYVWSPQWLRLLKKVRISKKRTFDASATPNMRTRRVRPRRLASRELQQLKDAMKVVVDRANDDNPAELRRRVASLQNELRKAKVQSDAKPNVDVTVREVVVPVLKETHVKRLEASMVKLERTARNLLDVAAALRKSLSERPATKPLALPKPKEVHLPNRAVKQLVASQGAPNLRSGERKMLQALAIRHPIKLTRAQLGTLAGFAPRGGTFGTYFSTLKRLGFVSEAPNGDVEITVAGLEYLGGDVPPAPTTTQEMIAMWRERLRAGEAKMLDILVSVYPSKLDRQALGEQAGFVASGGTFGTYLSVLRRNGLIEVIGDDVRASHTLFIDDAIDERRGQGQRLSRQK